MWKLFKRINLCTSTSHQNWDNNTPFFPSVSLPKLQWRHLMIHRLTWWPINLFSHLLFVPILYIAVSQIFPYKEFHSSFFNIPFNFLYSQYEYLSLYIHPNISFSLLFNTSALFRLGQSSQPLNQQINRNLICARPKY